MSRANKPSSFPLNFLMLAKNKSDQSLSPQVRCIPLPFILPLAIHLSIFVQIIHRLYTGADPGCLGRGSNLQRGFDLFIL